MTYLLMTAVAAVFIVIGIFICDSAEDVLTVDTLILIFLVVSNVAFLTKIARG